MNCEYHANKQEWMIGTLFQEYVRQFDKQMDDRKTLLFVDNLPTHPKIRGLKNMELLFLPPYTTSNTQPCRVRIMWAFKMHYHCWIYCYLLESYEVGQPNPKKINVLDATNLSILTWTIDVQANTIANCFWHCKIRSVDNMASYRVTIVLLV